MYYPWMHYHVMPFRQRDNNTRRRWICSCHRGHRALAKFIARLIRAVWKLKPVTWIGQGESIYLCLYKINILSRLKRLLWWVIFHLIYVSRLLSINKFVIKKTAHQGEWDQNGCNINLVVCIAKGENSIHEYETRQKQGAPILLENSHLERLLLCSVAVLIYFSVHCNVHLSRCYIDAYWVFFVASV